MAPLTLTPEQRQQLEYLVRHNPVATERCRVQAQLGLDEGESPEQVAESLRVSRRTVYYGMSRIYDRPGADLRERLADAPRPGRPATASGVIDPLIAGVIDKDPREWGYRSTNWTAGLLVRYLKRSHGIEVSRRSVGLAIDRRGITWKRPRHQLALRPSTWRQSKGG